MKTRFLLLAAVALCLATSALAQTVTISAGDLQPLKAQVARLTEALDHLGSPLTEAERAALAEAAKLADAESAGKKIQETLDARTLFIVTINPEMRVKVANGPAKPQLLEKGWRQFLVKVLNEAGTTSTLNVFSPHAQSLYAGGSVQNPSDRRFRPKGGPQDKIDPRDLWLDIDVFNKQPLSPTLSGLSLEYRIVSLYSRDAGRREGLFAFDVGQGTQDLGYRGETSVLFAIDPAHQITLRVQDEHGKPTTASFTVRDPQGRVYPSPAKRLAPDFGFHPQVYRADGETLALPNGEYTIEFMRGPESVPETRKVSISGPAELSFKVRRWIDPAAFGWISGDHHIHAAGCAHYSNPTEGVHAPDMMRHCLGEDLKIGANLTWGPCFDYQKQFFTGKDDAVSTFPYLLRYDVEVSGFGSHQSGHLCLLRLREQMYPGGDSYHHWPTLGLNTLRWAKKQGALVGPAHSGWGLQIKETKLPSFEMPRFDGIGANEYIVDVTHKVPGPDDKPVPAVDFLSMVDTPYPWELNIWYHTLNAGFRTRISGETDFPCIYGERVGLGRSYVKLPEKWSYEDWCEGIRAGRNYVSDGHSHILDFQVNDARMGENGSELQLAQPGQVKVRAKIAARLPEHPNDKLRVLPADQKPYWHIERARIEGTREVPVELIVNGHTVATRKITADGQFQDLEFTVAIEHSSWVALRILPSSHTNPVFVVIDGKPIRASRRSIRWCRAAVDQCWSQKERFYAEAEKAGAQAAYDHARRVYDRLLAEAVTD